LRKSSLNGAPFTNRGATVKIEPLNLMGNTPPVAASAAARWAA
jgi:hypothetical protein